MCKSGPYSLRAVYFGGGDQADKVVTPSTFAYEPVINSYRGIEETELRIKKLF